MRLPKIQTVEWRKRTAADDTDSGQKLGETAWPRYRATPCGIKWHYSISVRGRTSSLVASGLSQFPVLDKLYNTGYLLYDTVIRVWLNSMVILRRYQPTNIDNSICVARIPLVCMRENTPSLEIDVPVFKPVPEIRFLRLFRRMSVCWESYADFVKSIMSIIHQGNQTKWPIKETLAISILFGFEKSSVYPDYQYIP